MNSENPTTDSPIAESTIGRIDPLERPLPAERPRGLARFLWVDEETGDELSVDVRGNESFFRELEHLGFKRIVEEQGVDPRRSPSTRLRARVDVSPTDGDRRAWCARRGA